MRDIKTKSLAKLSTSIAAAFLLAIWIAACTTTTSSDADAGNVVGHDAGYDGSSAASSGAAASDDASLPDDSAMPDSQASPEVVDGDGGQGLAMRVGMADCQGGCAIGGDRVLCFAYTCPTCSPTPTVVPTLTSGVTAIAVGGSNGSNNTMQNSEPRSSISAQGTGAAGCSADFACAIKSGGLWCWGANAYGDLGNGTTTDSATPVQVTGLTSGVTAVAVAQQNSFACAVVNGSVDCWGRNDKGQLGAGTTAALSAVPVPVMGFTDNVTSISVGNTYGCALTVGGAVQCWGDNIYGQLGNGTTTSSTTPVPVTGLTSGVTSLSAGVNYACAVMGGAVQCWGNNGIGTPSMVPASIPEWSSGAVEVSSGQQHVCALIGGEVQCFGENAQGSLGNGTTMNSSTPVQVMGLANVTTMTAGDSSFGCAIKTDGSLWCWGGIHHTPFAISGFPQ
jgi:hypothetical protein